ncbi:MAG: hypothetical protein AAB610_02475 [Patescibacteria group bacterium]
MDPKKNPEPSGGGTPPVKLQYDPHGRRLTWITSSANADETPCTLKIACEEMGLSWSTKITGGQEFSLASFFRAKINIAGYEPKAGMKATAYVVYGDGDRMSDSGDPLEFTLPEIPPESQPQTQQQPKKKSWFVRAKLKCEELLEDWSQAWKHWRSQPKPVKPPRKPFKWPSFLKFKLKRKDPQPSSLQPVSSDEPRKKITAVIVSFFKRQPRQQPQTEQKATEIMKTSIRPCVMMCQLVHRVWQYFCEKILPFIGAVAVILILGTLAVMGYKKFVGSGNGTVAVATQVTTPAFVPVSNTIAASPQIVYVMAATQMFALTNQPTVVNNVTGSNITITVAGRDNVFHQYSTNAPYSVPAVSNPPVCLPTQPIMAPTNAAPAVQQRQPTVVVPVDDDPPVTNPAPAILPAQPAVQPALPQATATKLFPQDYKLDDVVPLKPTGDYCVLEKILPVGKFYAYHVPSGWTVIMETDTPFKYGYRQSIGGEEVAYGEHRFGNSLEYLNTWNKDVVITFKCTRNPPPVEIQPCDTGGFFTYR